MRSLYNIRKQRLQARLQRPSQPAMQKAENLRIFEEPDDLHRYLSQMVSQQNARHRHKRRTNRVTFQRAAFTLKDYHRLMRCVRRLNLREVLKYRVNPHAVVIFLNRPYQR